MTIRKGWKRGRDLTPRYDRYVEVGPLRLEMSVWPWNQEQTQWVYALQGKNADQAIRYKPVPSADIAMMCAEEDMIAWLHSAARLLRAK